MRHWLLPILLLCSVPLLRPQSAAAEEQSLTQEDIGRLRATLPRTLGKLERKSHVRVIAMGEGALNYNSPLAKDAHRTLRAWHCIFLRELGDRFYYGGGVQDVMPNRQPDPPPAPDAPPKALPLRGEIPTLEETVVGGATIFLYNYADDKETAIDTLAPLSTEAFDVPVDLAIFMVGTQDALDGIDLESFRQALERSVSLCKAKGADVIIASPPPICDGSATNLALNRPYAIVGQEIAAKLGVQYFDAGGALAEVSRQGEKIGYMEEKDPMVGYFDALRPFYLHEDTLAPTLPNALGHRKIAKAAWDHFVKQSTPPRVYATGSLQLSETPESPAQLEVTLRNPNATGDTLPTREEGDPVSRLTILPADQLWHPQGETSVVLKPLAKDQRVMTPMIMSQKPGSDGLRQSGNALSFSVLYHTPDVSRFLDMTGPVLPLALDIPLGRVDAVTAPLLLDVTVKNPFEKTLAAKLATTWQKSNQTLDLAVEAKGSKQLRLRLPLPGADRLSAPLALTLQEGGKSYVFQRKITALKHLCLTQAHDLVPLRAASTAPVAGVPDVTFKADNTGLFVQWVLPTLNVSVVNDHHVAKLELMIDARSPENSGKLGHVGSLTLWVPRIDGLFAPMRLDPGIFGTGYDRELDPWPVQAHVATKPNGQRVVQLQIPRAYFYLHQWSLLASGQNTLGVNTIVTMPFLPPNADKYQWRTDHSFALITSPLAKNDARSLAVLELRPKASGVWTVIVSP